MTKRTPLTDADGEVLELKSADLHHHKSADQALPPELLKKMGLDAKQLEQQNRLAYLSKQLSGRHLLENEALDATLSDGLE
jgi:hypothetical protein